MRKVIAGIMVLTSFMGAGQVAVATPKRDIVCYREFLLRKWNKSEQIDVDKAVLKDFKRRAKENKGNYMVASTSPVLEIERSTNELLLSNSGESGAEFKELKHSTLRLSTKVSSDYFRTPSLLDADTLLKQNEDQSKERKKQLSPSLVEEDLEFLPSDRKMYDSSDDTFYSSLSFEPVNNPNVIVIGYENSKNENKQ